MFRLIAFLTSHVKKVLILCMLAGKYLLKPLFFKVFYMVVSNVRCLVVSPPPYTDIETEKQKK